MQSPSSRVEERVAQQLVASAPISRRAAGHTRVDLVYVDQQTQDRLSCRSRPPT